MYQTQSSDGRLKRPDPGPTFSILRVTGARVGSRDGSCYLSPRCGVRRARDRPGSSTNMESVSP